MVIDADLRAGRLAELIAVERDPSYVYELWAALGRLVAPMHRIKSVWGLSNVEIAAMFGVSRQAIVKWIDGDVPPGRIDAVAEVAAATDLLVHHLKADRVPAVVRRPIEARDGWSLLELATSGRRDEVLPTVREMFAFGRAVA